MLLKPKTQHVYTAALSFMLGIKELNFEAAFLHLSSTTSASDDRTS